MNKQWVGGGAGNFFLAARLANFWKVKRPAFKQWCHSLPSVTRWPILDQWQMRWQEVTTTRWRGNDRNSKGADQRGGHYTITQFNMLNQGLNFSADSRNSVDSELPKAGLRRGQSIGPWGRGRGLSELRGQGRGQCIVIVPEDEDKDKLACPHEDKLSSWGQPLILLDANLCKDV